MSHNRPKQALADTTDVKSTPATGGKIGALVLNELYLLPEAPDPKAPPPRLVVNAVVLSPEGKDEYSAFFVKEGQWVKDKKNELKKVAKRHYSLDDEDEVEDAPEGGFLRKTKNNTKVLHTVLDLANASLPDEPLAEAIKAQEGKAGISLAYELYLSPTVDPHQKPPQNLVHGVVLCPEGKEEYTAYFVRNGQWLKENEGLKKIAKQKFALDTVKTEGLLEKNKINAKALDKALALGKIPSFAKLPHELLTVSIPAFLKSKASGNLARLSQSMHASFQSSLDASKLLKFVAYGQQEDAEKMLQKAQALEVKAVTEDADSSPLLRLLRAKNPITDLSGREFKEPLTPFQYAFWAMDWHMLRMLDKYMSKEEQAAQLQELRDKKINYEVILMSAPAEQKLNPETLGRLSSQQGNKPLLIKQGESILLYGYNFSKTTWELTPLKAKSFQTLHFPATPPSATYAFSVLNVAPTADNLAALLPGNDSAYVLVQKSDDRQLLALYFVDKSRVPAVITELSPQLALNHNLYSFAQTLFPLALGEHYPNVAALSRVQLETIALATGHGLAVADPSSLTEESYQALRHGHTQGTEHGVHYDFGPLLTAYDIYLATHEVFTREQLSAYWTTRVGKVQDQVPAQVRDEYCHEKRKFSPLPSFLEESLPRDGRLYDDTPFYSREGSGLGVKGAAYHGEGWGGPDGKGLDSEVSPRIARIDRAAMAKLSEVRIENMRTLTTELFKPTPPVAATVAANPTPK